MSLIVSSALAAVFVLNVVLGATGSGAFLSDVQEMLILLAASVFFTAAILRRETQDRATQNENHQQD